MIEELKSEALRLKNHILFSNIVTNDENVLAIFHYIQSIARSNEPVLITGETGVGKELLAQAIHRTSHQHQDNFVAVNVAGLDENMFSDALFGHVRGAFTGATRERNGLVEQAAGGTLFLDEIGDLAAVSQAQLLRLLQEGEYLPLGQDKSKYSNARIVSATNQDLWSLIHEMRFRKDLNFRLRTHHIHMPPLRERKTDIPLLVEHFLQQAAAQQNRAKPGIPQQLGPLLENYNFPGNVRELRSMVYNALSVSHSSTLALEPFEQHLSYTRKSISMSPIVSFNDPLTIKFPTKLPTIKEATESLIEEAMRRTNGNQSLAGQMLGISQQAVSKRLKSIASIATNS